MIKPVAEHAEKEGVLLLVEPEPGLLIETADQFEEFMKHMDSPAIGLNFDIGHHYCVKDDPGPTIERLAKHIRHIHLEDIAATRVHHHLVPGEGAIDFGAVPRLGRGESITEREVLTGTAAVLAKGRNPSPVRRRLEKAPSPDTLSPGGEGY